MARQLYETEDDLRNEQDIARIIQKKWGVELVKLPIKNKIDYLAKKEDIPKAFIEIKKRACRRHAYVTYMISLDKWVSGLAMEQHTSVPFILVVDWDDEIGYLKCSDVEVADNNVFSVNMGGRKDRGDAQDIEPVVHIHISQFKTLEKHQ